MKVLVAYASRHGSTAEIAEVVADTLTADGIVATVRNATDVRFLSRYDGFVIGSAVYYGWRLPAAGALQQRCALEAPFAPLWRFSSGPLTKEKVHRSPVTDQAGRLADRDVIFGGCLSLAGLDTAERSLVRITRHQQTDNRDWHDIRDWATRIRAELVEGVHLTRRPKVPLHAQLSIRLNSMTRLDQLGAQRAVR